ncbi:ABC1 kinase family protein [Fluviispira vulneris]|uniref:ABC1 kinase family protein n=1 Tax=Fluviispira vulneris TaxID=2763012 RepID=UPI0016448164|nr:AarF/ABC1/UbiB kinase family protein [Fluviispira vulneris]
MREKNSSKSRALSLIRTIGSTALKAGNEAIQKKLSKLSEGDSPISEAALRLVKGLDDLKGAAMKVGQILSMVDEKMLPPGWKEALSKLQANATAKDWSFIEPILLKAFGNLDDFEYIEERAVHAASIGQVHKARLKDGTYIALKVQYPNLEKSVKSDLQNMKRLINLANIMPNMANYDHTFEAVEKLFLEELDFIREKNFYELYKENFSNNPNIIVPKTISHLCRKNILATEWIQGENLQQWMTRNQSEMHSDIELIKKRDKIGFLLLDLVFKEIITFKHIQSDPNPGNFLITEDCKLVLLDFGATQKLSSDLIQNYAELCRVSLAEDKENIINVAVKMGFLFTDDSNEIKESFLRIMQLAMEPFIHESYSWRNCDMLKRINSESFHLMKLTKFRAPASEIIFMNRRLGGNLIMMEKLGATVFARELFVNILQ